MKSKWWFAGVTCLFVQAGVHAQSSVTLYGAADAGINFLSNTGGSHAWQFADGAYQPNELGFKGTEDLGAGNRALFVLENGYHLGTGQLNQGGALFGRQAYVGLGNSLGTLTFGIQYDFALDFTGLFNTGAYGSGYGVHLGNFDRQGGARLQNAVKFVSNSYHGLIVGGMYAFSNRAGDFHSGSAWSTGFSYQMGPFSAGGNYTRLNSPSGLGAIDPYAAMGVTSMLGQRVATVGPNGAVNDLYSTTPFPIDSQSIYGIGASWTIGSLVIAGDFSDTVFKGFGRTSSLRVYEPGVRYFLTPAMSLIAGYQYSTFENHHWHEAALSAHYLLSKRTEVYTSLDWMRASEGVDAVIGYSFTPSSTRNQTAVRIAMKHNW